jgi:hypothetical protein
MSFNQAGIHQTGNPSVIFPLGKVFPQCGGGPVAVSNTIE